MAPLVYTLTFRRPAKGPGDGDDRPASAPSSACRVRILPGGIETGCDTIDGLTAEMTNQATVAPDDIHFFESGTIRFGGDADTLTFSSLLCGDLGPAKAMGDFRHGSVMWNVDGGTGLFQGASGRIVSNFLIDLATDELIDHQLHVIFLAAA